MALIEIDVLALRQAIGGLTHEVKIGFEIVGEQLGALNENFEILIEQLKKGNHGKTTGSEVGTLPSADERLVAVSPGVAPAAEQRRRAGGDGKGRRGSEPAAKEVIARASQGNGSRL